MSFNPPEGILDIGNATLRVGKLEVAETTGLNQGLQNIVKNDLLITEKETYLANKTWGIKLPTAWVGEFDLKTHDNKYVEFNFYNEGSTSNALGYTLNFKDTTLTLKYDNGNSNLASETIPDVSTSTYKKVNVFFERGVIAVFIDGARVLYFKESDTYNSVHGHPGMASRVASTTGGSFVNIFIEEDGSDSAVKDLRIVNGRLISDKTSNVSFIGSLGVGVNNPKESLDIRGNMHLNRVSNVSQVSVDSNVVTEYTGPHDRPLREYPEVALTVDAETASGYKGYKVTATSVNTGASGARRPFCAFDGDAGTGARTNSGYASTVLNTSSTDYDTSVMTITDTDGTAHLGHWLKLELPKRVRFTRAEFDIYDASYAFKDYVILGSDDDTNWTLLDEATASEHDFATHFTSTGYFKYILISIKTIYTNNSTWIINTLKYYGHEEGSASLDTTLKTVCNVPTTTGTQLEVYYDAKNYTSGTITDESPNNYIGTLNGNTQLETVNGIKAFTFDGNGDTITGSISGASGEYVHSITFWVKYNDFSTANTGYTLFEMGPRAQNVMIGLYAEPGKVNYYFYGNDNSYFLNDDGPIHDQWYHFTATYSGGSDLSNRKLYINGNEIPRGSHAGSSSALSLTNGNFTIGDISGGGGANDFAGSIANFRIYSKALNADQVKELYDYQKDYFLGSKSQVTLYKGHLGVGVTEPSGQLELAGDERIKEYPPRAMTDYDTHIEGHGVFKVYASSWLDNGSFKSWAAFDKNINSVGWHDTNTPYTNGSYTGSNSLGGVKGEWIVLKLPYAINLKSAATAPRTGYTMRGPGKGVILGSNDGNNWDQLHSFSGLTSTDNKLTYINNITAPGYYTTVALLVTELTGAPSSTNTNSLNLSEIKFFGIPGPTTLDKGSLSLGRSLDVPRVSRYDVDTETPRPEKLILDYDTSVNPYPLDISGRGNHGTFYANASYSAEDKAFKFDGTNDTIYVDHNGNTGSLNGFPTGDATYTMSCWMKPRTLGNNSAVFYFGSSWTTSQLAGIYLSSANGINMDVGSYYIATASNTIKADEWVHVAIVKRGTGNVDNTHSWGSIYINGVEVSTTIGAGGGQQALQTIDNLSIGSNFNGSPGSFGEDYDGCIAKPQVWSVPLENSEIRKIYNLGHTGRSMVISDTAVGIGRHPRSQLDVRGVVRATSFLSESQPAFIAEGGSSTVYTTNGGIISSWTTLVNRGGMFKSNGYAYAPSDGIYFFHTNLYNEAGYIIIVDLVLNGKIKARGELASGTGNNSVCTLFGTFYMNKGDYVYLRNGAGRSEIIKPTDSAECYNQFVGYKLS